MSPYTKVIQCPECGQDTNELYHARFTKYGEDVLMCDACYGEAGFSMNKTKESNDYEN